jgi:hypothetical protein
MYDMYVGKLQQPVDGSKDIQSCKILLFRNTSLLYFTYHTFNSTYSHGCLFLCLLLLLVATLTVNVDSYSKFFFILRSACSLCVITSIRLLGLNLIDWHRTAFSIRHSGTASVRLRVVFRRKRYAASSRFRTPHGSCKNNLLNIEILLIIVMLYKEYWI